MILFTDVSDPEAPVLTEPEFWTDILQWLGEAGWKLLTVVLIVAGAVLLSWLLRLLIRRVVNQVVSGAKSRAAAVDTQAIDRSPLATMRIVQRTRTLGSILQNIVNVVIVIVTVLVVVGYLAPNVLGSFALLSAALGAGLGFGAQNIVKDVLNGIFIVAEDQIGIGDVVDMGLASGVVEYVSVRITHVRDVNGTLWYVRNGEVTRIGNMSQGWSRVILDVTIPADTDIDEAEHVLRTTAQGLVTSKKWRTRIVEHAEVWGLESVDGETLVLRLALKTRAGAKDDVAHELRMRVKKAIDEAGIESPSLATVMPTGPEMAGRVRGANPPKTQPTPIPVPERGVWRIRKKRGGVDPAAETPSRDAALEQPPATPGIAGAQTDAPHDEAGKDER